MKNNIQGVGFKAFFLLIFILLVSITLGSAFADKETLEDYWPMHAPEKSWSLIAARDKMSPNPKILMTVANKNSGVNQADLWFSNKPRQAAGASDVERYEYCSNPGGDPWLFFITYISAVEGKLVKYHPVQSTRILFTPGNGQTVDLIADGTYARCGNKGQPYLFWNQDLDKYRLQIWGYLTENPKWKWFGDTIVTKPAAVTNNCLNPAQTVKALKVQEAWWNNFPANPEGRWGMGSSGDMGGDGLPTGANVRYSRTVWYAQGQLPYYLTGRPDGKTVNWCVQQVMPATESGRS